jgi:hypothetical protein
MILTTNNNKTEKDKNDYVFGLLIFNVVLTFLILLIFYYSYKKLNKLNDQLKKTFFLFLSSDKVTEEIKKLFNAS